MTNLAQISRPRLSTRALGHTAIWLMFAMSSIVAIEPAPYDIAMVLLTVLFFLFGLRLPIWMAVPITLLVVFFVFGMIGAAQTAEMSESMRHIFITLYLAIGTIFIGCLVYRDPGASLRVIFYGYAVAALIAVIAGVLGYFAVTDTAFELFTENSRARGPFKDPNVFGPFLIPPALFAFYRLVNGNAAHAPFWITVFLAAMVGLLLSFSRGAWGHFCISFLLCLVLMFLTSTSSRTRQRIAFGSISLFVMGAAALVVLASTTAVAELLAERLQLLQAYDLQGNTGRFNGQIFAFEQILVNPFGLGSEGFSKLWGQNPHNVYFQAFVISGWIGGFAFLVLIFLTVGCGFLAAARPSPFQGIAIVIFSSFIGLMILGLLIDIDHWRHLYLLIGLIWGLSGHVLCARNSARITAPH